MAEKAKTLGQTLSAMRKGGSKVGQLTDEEFLRTLRPEGLSSGNITIDAITGGVGGLPRGRVIELFGPPSSGKTTTALQAAALVQQQGGRVLFLDHERSLDETYCRALGIDPDGTDAEGNPSFIYEQPKSFEQGANDFRGLMEWVDLVITDSIAAMVTEGELAAATGKAEFAARAKMMHQYMRQVTGPIVDTGTAMVFLNHIQQVIDTSPMGQKLAASGIKRTTTPGGDAVKFYASLRMSFKQIGNVRGTEYDPVTNEQVAIPTQTKTQVTVVKNKVGKPFGQGEVRVRFGKGFSNEWSALDILVRHGLIKKDTGGVYRFLDPRVQPSNLTTDVHIKEKTSQTPQHFWIRGEDTVLNEMEIDAAFRGAAISAARDLLNGGWDQQASAEEIAEFKADDEANDAAMKGETKAVENEMDTDLSHLDAEFSR